MKQPTHFFNLESTKSQKGESLIYLNLSYGYAEANIQNNSIKYIPLRISTGYRINSDSWISDKKNKIYKANATHVKKFGNELNNTLERIKKISYTCLNTYRDEHDKNPSPAELKELILIKLGKKERTVKDITLTSYIEDKCKYFEALPITSTASRKAKTVTAYRNLANLIKKYEEEKKSKLTFDNIDEVKYWDFFTTLNEIYKRDEKKEHGYTVTNVARICKNLLFFLRQAIGDGYSTSLNPDKKGLKIHARNGANEAYLNEEELLKVINFDTAHSSEFKNARNYIIISSLTGLRYDDMANLKTVEVENFTLLKTKFNGFFTKIRKVSKQNNEVVICIPILKLLAGVLKENNNRFPSFPTNQVLNRQIKKLCKHLEFDRILTCKHWYYGYDEVITENKTLHELADAHVMRKSFYTNLVQQQININVIESITHPKLKNRSMADIYNNTTRVENAAMFLNAIKAIKNKTKVYLS